MENVTVSDVILLISDGPPNLQSKLEAELKKIQDNKETLRGLMKENFLLHHDVRSLDEQIKMLVKNRITVEEITHKFSHLMPKQDGAEGEEGRADSVRATLTHEQQTLYGQLFFELQSKSHYLVRLSRLTQGSAQITNFVNTVLLSIFGDQYDNHDEQMLLVTMRDMLKIEFKEHGDDDVSTFMRSNSCLTMMVSNYVRRPGSINAVKDILGGLINEVLEKKDSLEVNPHKVYMELINSYEQSTGEKSTLPKDLSQDEIAVHPEVLKAQRKRLKIIESFVSRILMELEGKHDKIMYGIRYLTREVRQLAKEKWPDLTVRQEAAIMGGVFFLRFVTPIIVTPDGNNIVTQKVSKVARKNLTLIAKVMQNLSNGVLFGAKEVHLADLNDFVGDNFARMDRIFGKITDVEDVEEAMAMDQFLLINTVELTSEKTIKITFNEIMQMHTLLKDNFKDVILKENTQEPIAKTLFTLGNIKKEVPRSENTTFTLQLSALNTDVGKEKGRGPRLSVWESELNTRGRAVSKANEMTQLGLMKSAVTSRSSSSSANETEELRKTTKLLLSSILARLDLDFFDIKLNFPNEKLVTLEVVLHFGLEKAAEMDKGEELTNDINKALSNVMALRLESIMGEEGASGGSGEDEPRDPDSQLLEEVHQAYVQMNKSCEKVQKNSERLERALEAIEKQHLDLNEQIDTWRAYLENVKAQAMGNTPKASVKTQEKHRFFGGMLSNKEKKQQKQKRMLKISYADLSKKNVIVSSAIPQSAHSSVFFTFKVSDEVPGMFIVVGSIRGFEASRATLLLEDLLGEQERGNETLEMDNVTLHVNMLLHLLNTNFAGV